MSWPTPRPPGTPNLDKLEKMIRPQTGNGSDPQKEPQKPEGPKTPHRYSPMDHLYIAVLRGRLAPGQLRVPPQDIQDKMNAGDFRGLSREHMQFWYIRTAFPQLFNNRMAWNEDLERYAKGEPLSNDPYAKRTALSGACLKIAAYGGVFYASFKLPGWVMNKLSSLLGRQSPAKTESAMQMASEGGKPGTIKSNQSAPIRNDSVLSAHTFYQQPALNSGQRVEHLIQRELYLRELFRHKQ